MPVRSTSEVARARVTSHLSNPLSGPSIAASAGPEGAASQPSGPGLGGPTRGLLGVRLDRLAERGHSGGLERYVPGAFIGHGAPPDPPDLNERGSKTHRWFPPDPLLGRAEPDCVCRALEGQLVERGGRTHVDVVGGAAQTLVYRRTWAVPS